MVALCGQLASSLGESNANAVCEPFGVADDAGIEGDEVTGTYLDSGLAGPLELDPDPPVPGADPKPFVGRDGDDARCLRARRQPGHL